jgi:hypothetical protein
MDKIDFSEWLKLWSGKRGENSPVKIIGVRGAFQLPGKPNATATYDDLVVVIIGDQVTAWRASTDPTPALTKAPVNEKGAAQLCPGVHFMRKHLLHANPQYPCLIQAEEVRVYRLDKTGVPKMDKTGAAKLEDKGWHGIAIHSGGAGIETQKFSAGCTIIHNPDGYHKNPTWAAFINPINAAMSAHKLDTVPYLLIDGSGYGAPLPKLSNA